MKKNNDEKYMQRAIELARKGSGYVDPNPKVGAVIVKNDEIISEGFHKEFGGPHAEVEAVRNANSDSFEDCSMYVNLEPCSHYGKTPPCADMIIKKGFKRVVIGMKDPNPLVAGRGIERLRRSGIDVMEGVLEEESKYLNRFFIKHITTGIPYVVLKVAQSIDGKIALKDFSSKWLTGCESRKEVHKLRAEIQSILVGRNTVMRDNPSLNVRDVTGKNPVRIILDSNFSLTGRYNIFNDLLDNETIICHNKEHNPKYINNKYPALKFIPAEINENGKLDLKDILKKLGNMGISSVLIEGGAEIFSSFVMHGFVDELHIFTAPKIIGKGIESFRNINIKSLDLSYNFKLHNIEKCGDDVHSVYLKK
jgi:diaminohydroxyphosphoribosylaminopyrimidine deaminase/5-amino-6-(5-phosphoribosylamino)uracil reductase